MGAQPPTLSKINNDMEQQELQKPRTRKAWKHGERTQKMMSFRLDADLVAYLGAWANKGRLINELLRQAMQGRFGQKWQAPGTMPDETASDT